ncbi:MAG TPA: universal stress protein [Deltaproteobacteria bacterium]|nr:universal stress protein [Deltaproteobacteria bacterium]
MQVYKNILVTLDCSPVDDAVIEHVSALALQNNARVSLMHVVHSHTIGQDRALRESAEATLKARHEVLKAQGIEARLIIRSGEPETEILSEIEEGGYDLVAMATHGHSFIGSLLFGSVSRTLKHRISTPLLLIGPRL